jgi:hypothetical protein
MNNFYTYLDKPTFLEVKHLKIMLECLKKKYPNKDKAFLMMFLSVECLRILLGNEWVNDTIFNRSDNHLKKNEEGIKFFKTNNINSNSKDNFQWQERINKFTEKLLSLQKIKNFNKIIEDIKSGELESRFSELEVGSQLYRRNIDFEFVKESRIKGFDYDIKISEVKVNINCEVKLKVESTYFNSSNIKRTLKQAKTQMPNNEFGLIFLKIPESWSKEKVILVNLGNIIEKFLYRSKNIIGIIIRWEERGKTINIFFWRYKLFKNNTYLDNDEINVILENIDGPEIRNPFKLENFFNQ